MPSPLTCVSPCSRPRAPLRAALFATLVLACSRQTVGVDPASSAATTPSSRAPAVASASPPGDPGPCRVAPEYRGVVAGQPVFARFGREGPHLRGRYFYERVGIDIALTGTLADGGEVVLVEGPAASPSGRFEGRCEGASGVLAGDWRKKADAGASTAFRLVPIAPSETPIAATKRFSVNGPRPVGGRSRCKYEETRLELFALHDEAVERAMNHQGLDPRTGPMFDAEDVKAVQGCTPDGDDGVEAAFSQTLVRTFRELATITGSGYRMASGAAHPDYGIDFDLATWDLRTGSRVTTKDVLTRDVTSLLLKCAAKEHPESDGVNPYNGWQELGANLDLTDKGVHFFAIGFPHFSAGLMGQGPTVPYGVLLRDGLLRMDSPVRRAWEGVSPAAKDAEACTSPWE
jgi:hypothetical protein